MCSAWFNADEVFVGKVTSVQGTRFEVEVSRVLKGAPAATKVVTTESSRGRWNAAVGETRVVFARGGTVGSWSDPVDHPANVRSTMRAIDSLPDATLSLVEVDVVNIKPLPGHRFDLYGGEEGRRTAYSDDNGYFLFRVQPGQVPPRGERPRSPSSHSAATTWKASSSSPASARNSDFHRPTADFGIIRPAAPR